MLSDHTMSAYACPPSLQAARPSILAFGGLLVPTCCMCCATAGKAFGTALQASSEMFWNSNRVILDRKTTYLFPD